MRKFVHEDYMKHAIQTKLLRKKIALAVKFLNKNNLRFDSIAFRGMSGALYATPLALALDKHLIMVRKSIKNTHSFLMVEGYAAVQNYIIVDDFFSQGRTARAVVKNIEFFASRAKCLGLLEMANGSGRGIYLRLPKDFS